MSSREPSGPQMQRKLGHIGGRNMASLRYGFSCESLTGVAWRKTLYTWSRIRESRHCVSSYDSSGYQTQKKPGDTGGRKKVSLLCGFLSEYSMFLKRRKTLYNLSRSKASRQCGFFGVSSGYWTGRKICHSHYSQNSSTQNEPGCELLVD